jgi:hypothetical protein
VGGRLRQRDGGARLAVMYVWEKVDLERKKSIFPFHLQTFTKRARAREKDFAEKRWTRAYPEWP